MSDTAGAQARVGVIGLGVMGMNVARNLARRDLGRVAIYDVSTERTQRVATDFPDAAFLAAPTLDALVAALATPRIAIILVPAGEATGEVVAQLAALLSPGDVIVDAGNAPFEQTIATEARLRAIGLHFVGAGLSGGEEGALTGPSIMVGGSPAAYAILEPMLHAIAARVDDIPCVAHIGPDGAGHFVKMLHNGMEYADMQLIAEAYDVLRRVGGYSPAAIAEVFDRWNEGELESYLLAISARILRHVDAETGLPFVDVVRDAAGSKGTGVWSVQAALAAGLPVDTMAAAVFARALSGQREQRAVLGAHVSHVPPTATNLAVLEAQVQAALYAAKIVAYAQGFSVIAAGASAHDWPYQPQVLATIWRGGCIIRSRFLQRIVQAYEAAPTLPTLLADPYCQSAITERDASWRQLVATAVLAGVPVPGMSSALAHYDALRSARLPAALVQGQRDYFGAHTYQRMDRPGVFHTQWSGDQREHPHPPSTPAL